MNKLKEILNQQLDIIKSEPVRAFALLYPYLLVIGIGFGLLYISNLNIISRQNIPIVLSDTTQVQDIRLAAAQTVPAIDIFKLSQPTDSLLSKGKLLYSTNCVACHGEKGLGDGAGGAALNPAPRNFTLKDGWKNGSKISEIYRTLQEGITGSGMISYNFLLPEERIAIIHYLRSAFIPDAPLDTKDDLTTLDQTFNLSKGMQLSPQVPVAAAINLISDESKVNSEKINSILAQINNESNDIGAQLFNKVAKSKMLALAALSSSNQWQENKNLFIKLVSESINTAGFSNEVNSLTSLEWDALFNYLSKKI
ncbi:MAG: cytochrome c [Ignavibacteriaceae bacterium]|nr:cytochrome c [Ignavibacteriaceae bacterium]